MFGIDLLKKLKSEHFDIVRLSKWCERIYSSNIRNIDDELRGILFDLFTMEDDSQFERTQEDLQTLAEKLIYEDISLLNVQKAIILDEQWLMCSNCNEAWKEQISTIPLVFCTKCDTTFINPRFKNKIISKPQLGKELKTELEKGFDITRLSRWAYSVFFNTNHYLSEELKETLEYLFRMEDDSQFEYTESELNLLAQKLIDNEESSIRQINRLKLNKK